MKGFFDIEEVEEEVMKPKPRKVKREVVYSCESCGLYKKCNSPKMKVQGNGKQGILVIIDPPTLKADRLGKTYVGQTRYLLKELCTNAELDLQDDVYVVNSIQCHHKETNKATIPTCRERLCAIIDELKPKAVVAMGTSAISVLFNELITIGAVSRWDGWEIPFRNTVVYTTYGIQDILMYKENVVLMGKVTNQLKRAKEAPPYVDYVDKADKAVEILTKAKDIQNMLLTMETKDIVAFDYETTGLQPYKQGHKIISMSVSDGEKSYAFLMSKTVEPYVKHFLHSSVRKVAHNAKYEIQWSMHFFDGIENAVADTMNDAHLLNNAKAIVKLEFQAFVNFGIPDYSTDIKHLITSDAKEGPHAFNKLYYMEQSGDLITVARDLLYYNAVDSLVTAWLYERQEAIFSSDTFLQGGRNLFFQAMLRFAKIEYRGMSIDHKKVKKNIKEIDSKLKVLYNMIYDTDEVGQWAHEYPFKFSSPMHLADLLFTTLGYKVLERTNGGAPSVEAPTLEKLNEEVGSELITLIISYRKLEKMKTYLEGIDRGALDGRLHTSFNLHKASSYRSSSSGINFQNIPKRSVLGRQYIRSVFTVGEKYLFEEIDFNSLEVNIGNCYHQDPMMIEYLSNEDADMHADVGCQLVLRDRSNLLKEERQTCKGSFVFAEQYGDYYVACARNLWKNFKPVTKKHLASKGYKTLDQYTELVRQVEDDFWNNRFKVFGQWRKDNYETYLKNGYLDFYTGFRSTAFLSKNQANNIPIQGSAFHCLLWVLIYLYDKIEEEGLDCHITGQIHDSIAIEVNPEDADRLHVITSDALYKLKEYWQWITAPLSMGYDQSPVGGTWLEAKEKGVIR